MSTGRGGPRARDPPERGGRGGPGERQLPAMSAGRTVGNPTPPDRAGAAARRSRCLRGGGSAPRTRAAVPRELLQDRPRRVGSGCWHERFPNPRVGLVGASGSWESQAEWVGARFVTGPISWRACAHASRLPAFPQSPHSQHCLHARAPQLSWDGARVGVATSAVPTCWRVAIGASRAGSRGGPAIGRGGARRPCVRRRAVAVQPYLPQRRPGEPDRRGQPRARCARVGRGTISGRRRCCAVAYARASWGEAAVTSCRRRPGSSDSSCDGGDWPGGPARQGLRGALQACRCHRCAVARGHAVSAGSPSPVGLSRSRHRRRRDARTSPTPRRLHRCRATSSTELRRSSSRLIAVSPGPHRRPPPALAAAPST